MSRLERILKEAIDLHFHAAPALIPRQYSIPDLIESERGKIRAICLKSHFFSSCPLIECANIGFRHNRSDDRCGPLFIGSVTLNYFMGGINPGAVYAAARLSDAPVIVWFPTIHAANWLKNNRDETPLSRVSKHSSAPLISHSFEGINLQENKADENDMLCDTLKTIKDMGCILATGHLSAPEILKLVNLAVNDYAISRIIITHPSSQIICMPLKIQKELADRGAFIEFTYALHSLEGISFENILSQIEQIGYQRCILSSDAGQIGSKPPSVTLKTFSRRLISKGLNLDHLERMLVINPSRLIES